MKTKAQFVIGRERELKVLLDYVTTGQCEKGALRESKVEDEEDLEKKKKREKQCQEGEYGIYFTHLMLHRGDYNDLRRNRVRLLKTLFFDV